MEKNAEKLTAIDLFCGAGALSIGLKQAGFDVVAGVEICPEISKTYQANHKQTKLFTKDIRMIKGKDLLESSGVKKVSLIAGCPPCQGFSSLTQKYKRPDPRNELALEMARIIEEIKPEMVMMENVPGLATKGKSILDAFVSRIEALGYIVNMGVLQLADYGIPQRRRRFVLLAGKGFAIPLPLRTRCFNGDNKKKLKPWLTLSNAIKDMKQPVTLSMAIKKGGPVKFKWHVVRDLEEISLKRIRSLKPGGSSRNVPKRLRPKCHANVIRGFQNVYGRLTWDQIAPTMTSGCTTPCMGRFTHPDEDRTISIREAALIQTFPKNFRFETEYMDYACTMVGNALPCKFAKLAAKTCILAYPRGETNDN